MSFGKSKAPAPPDPKETAAAQTAQNVSTAIAQQQLNNVNQITPDGTLTYNQTGSYQMTDPNSGEVYDVPLFTAIQELSEAGQQVKAAQDQADINLSNLAASQSERLDEVLNGPIDLSTEATEARLMELGRQRLDPALDRRREQLSNQLSQQGIRMGSTAYDRAMEGLNQSENDAYNQLLLTGRGQAMQEAYAQRNQPINEITALLSGSQVSNPNFVNANPAQLGNVDVAGLINTNYNQQLARTQQQNAQSGALLGGLFSLGGSALAGGFF
jgi:endonuclease/exonuclease/phosphatase (EEP) superfamily protein YafD